MSTTYNYYALKPFEEIKKTVNFDHDGYYDILENFYSTLPKKIVSGRISVNIIPDNCGKKGFKVCIEEFGNYEDFFHVTGSTMEDAINKALNFFNTMYEYHTEQISNEGPFSK